jgi:hypothetical protein
MSNGAFAFFAITLGTISAALATLLGRVLIKREMSAFEGDSVAKVESCSGPNFWRKPEAQRGQ